MTSTAQRKNQIQFILPDSVEVFLNDYINKVQDGKSQFYFLFQKDTAFSITVGRYTKKEKKNILKWIPQSNRYVVVNTKNYPVIFDYDLKFAAVDPNNIGEFGRREGNIKRAHPLLHGITVFFNGSGDIIRTEN